MTLAVAWVHLQHQAITTEIVAATEVSWLVQDIYRDFVYEMFKARWRLKKGKID